MLKFLAPLYSPRWMTSYFIWPFVILLLLIWFPFTGFFLMMMLGIPFIIAGILPHLIAAAFVIDVLYKKLPKALLLISILPYVVFYGYYFADQAEIKKQQEKMLQNNSIDLVTYDPEVHSLIIPNSYIVSYDIPVSYTLDPHHPAGYKSHRLLTKNLCTQFKDMDQDIKTANVRWYPDGWRSNRVNMPNICNLLTPALPPKQKLLITENRPQNRKSPLQETTYDFFLEDQKLGEISTATYMALPPFPVLIFGCFLNSGSASWDCINGVYRFEKDLDVFAEEIDTDIYGDWVLAPVLKIAKRSREDLEHYTNDPENAEFAINLIKRKLNATPDDFDHWGLRKDGFYQPELGEKDGYPRFKSTIFSGNKGGPFYDFMKAHEGQIVYLDIRARTNPRKDRFNNYGVCNDQRPNCSGRTDDYYYFQLENGERYKVEERGVFKGFFRVGPQELSENTRTPEDYDTRTVLTKVDIIEEKNINAGETN